VPKLAERRNPQYLGRHIRGTDNTGTDQERHDPQPHNNISDKAAEKSSQIICDMKVQINFRLPLQIAAHHVRYHRRDIQSFPERAEDALTTALQLLFNIQMPEEFY